MAFDVSDALEELEDEFSEAITWGGNSYPCISSVSRASSNLSDGGFSPRASATFTLRASLFAGTFPGKNNTLAFTRQDTAGNPVFTSAYAIQEVVQMPGGLVQFVCVAEDEGI